jgi:uncharacterized membrane protein
MGKTDAYAAELEELVWDPKNADELAEKLMAESNLPGPRGNLELVEAFTRAVSTAAAEPAAWLDTLYNWAAISAEDAPTGNPREFLPFCALVSFGVLYNTHACAYPYTGPCDCPLWPIQSEHLMETVRRAASDSRWRIREAVAMSLQHLGEGNPQALRRILDDWLSDGGGTDGTLTDRALMERRAVLAALAHPPLLGEEEFARYALKTAEGILEDAAGLPEEKRKGEAFQILKKGLSYALSVLVAASPEDGFALLERWAKRSNPNIRRILVENLKKKRLEAVDAERVAVLLQTLVG